MQGVSVIILTFNEHLHIRRCIESVRRFADRIIVVDSYSTDDTCEIARSLGAEVHQNAWINYASQFNWALSTIPIESPWVMRMDADEYVTPELADEIRARLDRLPTSVVGAYVKRRVFFMRRWIRHGGYYPTWLLRIWRTGQGHCEVRWMDEHIKLNSGDTVRLAHDIIDDNHNTLTWWTSKHNSYATREAVDLLNLRHRLFESDRLDSAAFTAQERLKRFAKERIYAKLPLGIRAFAYFVYRYVLRLGFLDGVRGTIFHVLQGFWYRFLVDAKVYEIEARAAELGLDIKTTLETEYAIRVG